MRSAKRLRSSVVAFGGVLRYDFLRGAHDIWWKLLVVAGLTLSFGLSLIASYGGSAGDICLLDYLAYFIKGAEKYDPSLGIAFTIPVLWITALVVLFLLTVFYPVSDFAEGSSNTVTRSSRVVWWLSKCAWTCAASIAFHSIGLLVVFAMTVVLGGQVGEAYHPEIVFFGDGDLFASLELSFGQVLSSLTLSFFVSTLLCLLLLLLSFAVGLYGAMAFVVGYLFLSVFVGDAPFIADYGMLARSCYFYSGVAGFAEKFFVVATLMAIVVVAGAFLFKGKDYAGSVPGSC